MAGEGGAGSRLQPGWLPRPHRCHRAAPRPCSVLGGLSFSLCPLLAWHSFLLSIWSTSLSFFCPVFNTLRTAICSPSACPACSDCSYSECWVPVVWKTVEIRIPSCRCYAGTQDFQEQTCLPGCRNSSGSSECKHMDRDSSESHSVCFSCRIRHYLNKHLWLLCFAEVITASCHRRG